MSTFFFFNFYLFYLFIFGCVGSSFLCEGFLQLRQVGATLHRGARASHCCGLSCCGAQAPDVQAQQLWLTGLVAPRHVGSSQTRARTRVPCISRQIINHCAIREAHEHILNALHFYPSPCFMLLTLYFVSFYFMYLLSITVIILLLLYCSLHTSFIGVWSITFTICLLLLERFFFFHNFYLFDSCYGLFFSI